VRGGPVARIGTGKLLHLALGFLFRYSITFLNPADQLIAFPADHLEIVIRQFSPLFLHSPRSLLPFAFHLIPVHGTSLGLPNLRAKVHALGDSLTPLQKHGVRSQEIQLITQPRRERGVACRILARRLAAADAVGRFWFEKERIRPRADSYRQASMMLLRTASRTSSPTE
jgi:hypothetical protein